jgi:Flp pilus assembly protein TadG
MMRPGPKRHFWRNEDGGVAVIVLVFMAAILGIFVTMQSFSMRYVTLTQLQTGADAAALAATRTLQTSTANAATTATAVRTAARNYASANLAPSRYAAAVQDKDVTIGNWNPVTRSFTPNSAPLNAVRVYSHQTAENGNAHRDLLPAIVGAPGTIDLRRAAIAYATRVFDPCSLNGFVAGRQYNGQSDNLYNGFCLHGNTTSTTTHAISIQGANRFANNSTVSAHPRSRGFSRGSGTVGWPTEVRREFAPFTTTAIDAKLAAYKVRNLPVLPWMNGATPTFVTVSGDKKSNWLAGRFYIVSGDVEIDANASGFGVYSDKKIVVKGGRSLENVFLAARDNIEIDSNVRLGAVRFNTNDKTAPLPAECGAVAGTVFMMSRNLVKLGSDVVLSGAQVVAGTDFETGSKNMLYGIGVQTARDVKIGSNNRMLGCTGMENRLLEQPANAQVLVRLVR